MAAAQGQAHRANRMLRERLQGEMGVGWGPVHCVESQRTMTRQEQTKLQQRREELQMLERERREPAQ